jgi:hypothetical protein
VHGEIVASDVAGMPTFWGLFMRSANPGELHVWRKCAQDGQRTIWVRVGDHPPAGLKTCGPQSCSARLWRLWKMPERPHGRTRTHRLAAAATG